MRFMAGCGCCFPRSCADCPMLPANVKITFPAPAANGTCSNCSWYYFSGTPIVIPYAFGCVWAFVPSDNGGCDIGSFLNIDFRQDSVLGDYASFWFQPWSDFRKIVEYRRPLPWNCLISQTLTKHAETADCDWPETITVEPA